jgi:hypothetical protein
MRVVEIRDLSQQNPMRQFRQDSAAAVIVGADTSALCGINGGAVRTLE